LLLGRKPRRWNLYIYGWLSVKKSFDCPATPLSSVDELNKASRIKYSDLTLSLYDFSALGRSRFP
jgi:hypothetical protein